MTRKAPTAARKAGRAASAGRHKQTAAERQSEQQAAARGNKALGDGQLTPWQEAKAARALRRKDVQAIHKN